MSALRPDPPADEQGVATGDQDVEAADLRLAMAQFATGVTIVTTVAPDGELHGMTVNSVTSVSLHPPLILTCLRNDSGTLAAIAESGSFAVTLLAQHQQELASRFASARTAADWKLLSHSPGLRHGAPLFPEGLASIECAVHRIDDGGDHRIVLGRVVAITRHPLPKQPLLFFDSSFRRLPSQSSCIGARSHRRANPAAFQVHEGCIAGGMLGGLWCTCGAEDGTLPAEPTSDVFADVL